MQVNVLRPKPEPRVVAKRRGLETTCRDLWTDTVQRIRADSAPEARRFVDGVQRIAGWQPRSAVARVVQRAVLEHSAANAQQLKRRFGSCFR